MRQKIQNIESECVGNCTLSTAVDGETKEWIRRRAEAAGVSPAEYLRRVLDVYRTSTEGELSCSGCGTSIDLAGVVE